MYKRNIKPRGKTISIAYSECVSIPLGIQHAMRRRHIVILKILKTSDKRTFKMLSALVPK
jgi:hypothetical protein